MPYKELCKRFSVTPLEMRRKQLDHRNFNNLLNSHINCPDLLCKILFYAPCRRLRCTMIYLLMSTFMSVTSLIVSLVYGSDKVIVFSGIPHCFPADNPKVDDFFSAEFFSENFFPKIFFQKFTCNNPNFA